MQASASQSPVEQQQTIQLFRDSTALDTEPNPFGFQVGPYAILDELGCGGMGIVYRAYQAQLDRQVALKMLHLGMSDPDSRQRFAREVELAARLNHPGIVTVYDSGEYQGQPYFTMELIEGQTLAEYLKDRGPMPVTDAARLVLSLARAVQHAHEHLVLHRDLKPANVLMDQQGQPHIADFGLSRPLMAQTPEGSEHANLSRPGVVIGTPAYMAPEQAMGAPVLGPGTDIYALGAILYECLTGRPPFQGRSPFEILRQLEQSEPLSPRRLLPHIPEDLTEICMLCLRKKPEERYASAAELVSDLERFLDGEPPQRVQSTLGTRIKRLLNFHQLPAQLRSWSGFVLLTGAIVLMAQVVVTLLLVNQPTCLPLAVLTTRVSQFLLILLAFYGLRPRPTEGPSAVERQLTGVWFGFLGACTFCCLLTGTSLGPATPQEELQVYPYLCVLSLFALVVLGAGHCGCCYLGAGAFAVLGLLSRLLDLAMVPLFGVVWAATLLLISRRLARLYP